MFTFKSPSHLLKLSLSHALAQSAKLSIYESLVQSTMADASYIPKELAMTGTLGLDRKDAVKLTGRLFKLRVDVNLVSNVLGASNLSDVPPSATEKPNIALFRRSRTQTRLNCFGRKPVCSRSTTRFGSTSRLTIVCWCSTNDWALSETWCVVSLSKSPLPAAGSKEGV